MIADPHTCLSTALPAVVQVVVSASYYERDEGQSVSMGCSFSPPDTVTAVDWLKEGTQRVAGTYSLSDPTLTLQRVSAQDAAVYYCQVLTNWTTFRSQSVNLMVNYPPSISLVKETTFQLTPGQSVTLRCPAIGYPPVSITWLKDGAVFPLTSSQRLEVGGRGETIKLVNVLPGDSASYQCTATNRLGRDTGQQFAVLVQLDPVATVNSTVVASEGSNFVISCQILMFPAATTIRWFKGNSQIDVSGSPAKYGGGTTQTPSLTVFSAAKGDTGTYRCQGSNGADTVSGTSDVTVTYLPKVSVPSREIQRTEGQSATISCDVDASPPASQLHWRRHAQGATIASASNLQITGRYSGGSVSQPSLTIASVQGVDDAVYYCVVTNSIGETVSQPVSLRILYQPRFTEISSNPAQVKVGDPFELTCRTDAYPASSSFTWFRNNVRMSTITDATYSVAQASPSDYVEYRCEVSNSQGKDSATYTPDIQFAPQFVGTGTENLQGGTGSTVTLECSVIANPAPTAYVWYKGSDVISGASTRALTVTLLSQADYGSYSCSAANTIGLLNPARTFTVSEPNQPDAGAVLQNGDDGLSTATIALIVVIVIILLIIIILLIVFCCMQGFCAKCLGKGKDSKVGPTQPMTKGYTANESPYVPPPMLEQKVRMEQTMATRSYLPPTQAGGAIISVPEKSGARAHHLPPLEDDTQTVNYYKEEKRRSRPKKRKSKKHAREDKAQLTGETEEGSPKEDSSPVQQ